MVDPHSDPLHHHHSSHSSSSSSSMDYDTDDTSVSELTSKLSGISISFDDSRDGLSFRQGTPLKERLESLKLKPQAEYASRIPKRASIAIFPLHESSSGTSNSMNISMNLSQNLSFCGLVSPSPGSRLPLPTRKHHSMLMASIPHNGSMPNIQTQHRHSESTPAASKTGSRLHYSFMTRSSQAGSKRNSSVISPNTSLYGHRQPSQTNPAKRSSLKRGTLEQERTVRIERRSERRPERRPDRRPERLSVRRQTMQPVRYTLDGRRVAASPTTMSTKSTPATTPTSSSHLPSTHFSFAYSRPNKAHDIPQKPTPKPSLSYKRATIGTIPAVEHTHQKRLTAIKEATLNRRVQSIEHYRQKRWRSPSEAKVYLDYTDVEWKGKVSTDSELLSLIENDAKLDRLFGIYLKSVKDIQPGVRPVVCENMGSTHPDIYNKLSVYEKGEMLKGSEVYFVGTNRIQKPKTDSNDFKSNFGFDDPDKNYICIPGDHINYRYEIGQSLGRGTFGAVVSARDHKSGRIVAVKLVKNRMDWSLQAVNEVKYLRKCDQQDSRGIVKYVDHFNFRSHMCIVTQLLSVNLFQVIEATKFKGLGLELVKRFCVDVLKGLHAIHSTGSIHCDLKPENLMLSYSSPDDLENGKFSVKIIDFGSSCSVGSLAFSYLQSRYYRAPEVSFGARYNEKIDIWSFGAIAVELFVGMPIFQADDEYALLDEFMSYFGAPPRDYILGLRQELLQKGSIGGAKLTNHSLLWRGFDKEGAVNTRYLTRKSPNHLYRASTKTVKQFLMRHCQIDQNDTAKLIEIREFAEFIERTFTWNRDLRASCSDLLEDRFCG